jgi:iron(III) transport system ATP-binding protein
MEMNFFSENKNLPAEKRNIGMVFQDYALFPHMTLYENIAFGIKNSKRKKIRSTIEGLAEMTGLMDHINKYPHEISGGQQQRVALARALAPKPSLLLLDEPFSSLDISLRESLSIEVRKLLKEFKITALMVTHDQKEAFSVADKTGIMMKGNILQWDKADVIYNKPEDADVADFIGEGFFLKGRVLCDKTIETELGTIEKKDCISCPGKDEVSVFLRPQSISLDNKSGYRARVMSECFRGPERAYKMELPSGTVINALSSDCRDLECGKEYRIRLDFENAVVF